MTTVTEPRATASARMTRSSTFWLASCLFLLSGYCGLTYEVLWFKRFSYLWGSSSLAMAAVVASFLCGLGLGAWCFGAFADRASRPLKLYGLFELGIGALALLVPLEAGWLESATAPLYGSLSSQPALLALARFALTFAVIGPPCVLMGATLPLLTRELASRGVALGTSTAWLYAFNALGAALGAWLTGFHLLPALGLNGVNVVAIALNVAVGFAAIALANSASNAEPRDVAIPAPALHFEAPPVHRRALFLAAAFTGCASLVLQMLWTRQLAVIVGGTTYAFSATLFVFILGLGLGSLWFRVAARRRSLESTVCTASLLIVIPTLFGLWALPHLALLAGYVQEQRSSPMFNAAFCCMVSAVLQAPATFGMGLLFPALVALTGLDAAHAGRAVGRVYALNTLGAIVGSALTSLVLLPAIGSFWAFRLALAVYAALPALLWRSRSLALSSTILAAVVLLSDWRRPDPMLTNLGLFMYGAGARDLALTAMSPVFFEEGSGCNVLVLEGHEPTKSLSGRVIDKVVNVRVNGKIDASNADDMVTQLGIAYMPRFLRPRASEVLVIGMGSGTTVGASALFPNTRVTACELEPAIVEASRYFEPYNHAPTKLQNVEIVLDDGRGYLQTSERRFDLVISEPSNPWIAGASNLFTREFYETVALHLQRDGVFAQWLQIYSFSAREYALVARTVTSVFPHCVFVRINAYDTLILASIAPLLPNAQTLDVAQKLVDENVAVKGDLERWFATSDVRSVLLERMLLDENGLRRFLATVGGDALNTDANLRLEFAAALRLFHPRGNPAVETNTLLLRSMDIAWQRDLFARFGADARHIEALRGIKTLLFQHSVVPQGRALVDLALAYEPDDPELLADFILFSPELSPEEFAAEAARVVELSPREAYRLARSLAQLGQTIAAPIVLEKLVEKLPTSATAWSALGLSYRAIDRPEEAERALAKARELDPLEDELIALDAATPRTP